MGVDKKTDVASKGVMVVAGFAASGVDADSVANRFVVGVGADVPKVQARSASKSPIKTKSRLSILFFN
jgi:hypothetical protein